MQLTGNDNAMTSQPAGLDGGRELMCAGAVLVLLGLLTGLIVPALALPRMGLSAHLQGITNGMLLIVLGLAWPRLMLNTALAGIAFWAALFGSYANWLAVLLAAATGAAALMPIAGGSSTGPVWAEIAVACLLIALTAAMIVAAAIIAWGLRPTGR
jgi:(hydroxyamino)benzene mutase